MYSFTIPRIFDAHLHLRQPRGWRGDLRCSTDGLLQHVLPFSAAVCARSLVMPNTVPPILSAQNACDYRQVIMQMASTLGYEKFEPLMTIYLTGATTPQMIREAKEAGVVAVKWYPKGASTNSASGLAVDGLASAIPTLRAIADSGLVLSVHAEDPGRAIFCMNREDSFISLLRMIMREVPTLRIVVEHVTSEAMINFVEEAPATVAATVTAHHLVLTLDDVVGIPHPNELEPSPEAGLRPHNYCLPVAKRSVDMDTLHDVVGRRSPKFFLGSDSAPHLQCFKESGRCAAGCFTAPLLLPLIAEVFMDKWWTAGEHMANFTSRFAEQFYGLKPAEGELTLVRKSWVVPSAYPAGDGEMDQNMLVPFWAGRTLNWQVA
jgi:dihydroorotase